jgi:Flp pilus assembly pilin Flp
MNRALAAATRLFRQDDGQDLVEYALLATLIVLALITVVAQLGSTINSAFWQPIAQNF